MQFQILDSVDPKVIEISSSSLDSVKIEKFDDEVRFNFISPDSRIRDLLDETMDTILQTVRSSLSSDTKLTGEIFSSYRDL